MNNGILTCLHSRALSQTTKGTIENEKHFSFSVRSSARSFDWQCFSVKLLSIFRVYVYLCEVTSGSHSWNCVFSCALPLALALALRHSRSRQKQTTHNNNNKETHQLNNLRVNEHRVHKKEIDKREIHRFVVQHQPYILCNFAQNSDYCSHCYMISLCIVVPGAEMVRLRRTQYCSFYSLFNIQWLWTSFCARSPLVHPVAESCWKLTVFWFEHTNLTALRRPTVNLARISFFGSFFLLLHRTINANG